MKLFVDMKFFQFCWWTGIHKCMQTTLQMLEVWLT